MNASDLTHSYTDDGGYYLRCQPAHRERLGVQCLAQGHLVRRSGVPHTSLGSLGTLLWPVGSISLSSTLNRKKIKPKKAGPRPLHSPRIPVTMPCTAPGGERGGEEKR